MSPTAAATAAKSLQSCPTLCDPIDGSPPGSTIPGILQARTLEWAAISFSNAWKWKVKGKLLSRVELLATHGQPTRLLHPWDSPSKSTGAGCHCLLRMSPTEKSKTTTSFDSTPPPGHLPATFCYYEIIKLEGNMAVSICSPLILSSVVLQSRCCLRLSFMLPNPSGISFY